MNVFLTKINQGKKKRKKSTLSFLSEFFSMELGKICCKGACMCVCLCVFGEGSGPDGSGLWPPNYVPVPCVYSSSRLAEAHDF